MGSKASKMIREVREREIDRRNRESDRTMNVITYAAYVASVRTSLAVNQEAIRAEFRRARKEGGEANIRHYTEAVRGLKETLRKLATKAVVS